jgi:hypothetical protein
MTEIAEEYLIAFPPENFFLLESGQSLHGLIERGDTPFQINGKNTYTQILQELAELLM